MMSAKNVNVVLNVISVCLLLSSSIETRAQTTPSVSEPEVVSQSDWGPAADGLQLAAKISPAKHYAGELIVLRIYIRNLSDKASSLVFIVPPDQAFNFDTKDIAGNPLALTRWGKIHQYNAHPDPFNIQIISLPASQVTKFQFAINRRYDLTLAGTYTVVVKYPLASSAQKSSIQLVSKPVRIDVQSQDADFTNPTETIHR